MARHKFLFFSISVEGLHEELETCKPVTARGYGGFGCDSENVYGQELGPGESMNV